MPPGPLRRTTLCVSGFLSLNLEPLNFEPASARDILNGSSVL